MDPGAKRSRVLFFQCFWCSRRSGVRIGNFHSHLKGRRLDENLRDWDNEMDPGTKCSRGSVFSAIFYSAPGRRLESVKVGGSKRGWTKVGSSDRSALRTALCFRQCRSFGSSRYEHLFRQTPSCSRAIARGLVCNSDRRNRPTIDHVFASGDGGSSIRCQKCDQFGNFFRSVGPAKRDAAE